MPLESRLSLGLLDDTVSFESMGATWCVNCKSFPWTHENKILELCYC